MGRRKPTVVAENFRAVHEEVRVREHRIVNQAERVVRRVSGKRMDRTSRCSGEQPDLSVARRTQAEVHLPAGVPVAIANKRRGIKS